MLHFQAPDEVHDHGEMASWLIALARRQTQQLLASTDCSLALEAAEWLECTLRDAERYVQAHQAGAK